MSLNRDEGFDAGPFREWKTKETGVDLKDCLNVRIDEDQIKLLIIGLQLKDNKEYQKLTEEKGCQYPVRFAMFSKIIKEEGDKLGINYCFARPSLPHDFLDPTPEQKAFKEGLEKIFGTKIVVAEKVLTGIVHEKAKKEILKEAELKGNKERMELFKKLPQESEDVPPPELGFSAIANDVLSFLNRGAMNRSIQDLNPAAHDAFMFALSPKTQGYDHKKNHFIKNEYTLEYHLSRSLIKEILQAINNEISKQINLYIDKYQLNIPKKENWGVIDESFNGCYSYVYDDFWEKYLRYNKKNLAEFYLKNLYIAAGFDPHGKPSEFWPKNKNDQPVTDSGTIAYLFNQAKQMGLTLDVNKIPHEFKFSQEFAPYNFSTTLIMYAARRDSLLVVKHLIYKGADITLKDHDGHDAIWYAKNSDDKNTKIIEYLEMTNRLFETINNLEKGSDHHLIYQVLNDAKGIIDLEKPFYKGKTALSCAASLKNPFMLNTILDELQNNGVDQPDIPSGHTPLFIAACHENLANMIVLLQAGANPDLVVHSPDFKQFIKNESIQNLLDKWKHPLKMQTDLKNIIDELKLSSININEDSLLEEINYALKSTEPNFLFVIIMDVIEKVLPHLSEDISPTFQEYITLYRQQLLETQSEPTTPSPFIEAMLEKKSEPDKYDSFPLSPEAENLKTEYTLDMYIANQAAWINVESDSLFQVEVPRDNNSEEIQVIETAKLHDESEEQTILAGFSLDLEQTRSSTPPPESNDDDQALIAMMLAGGFGGGWYPSSGLSPDQTDDEPTQDTPQTSLQTTGLFGSYSQDQQLVTPPDNDKSPKKNNPTQGSSTS